jgi:serine/threonine protein kinase
MQGHLVRHKITGEHVEMKRLCTNNEAMERDGPLHEALLHREACTYGQLQMFPKQLDHIVHCKGLIWDDSVPFVRAIVLQHCGGGSLSRWLPIPPDSATPLGAPLLEQPLPLLTRLELEKQMLQGLQQLHSAGFVHLDIKPDNIFLRGAHSRDLRSVQLNMEDAVEVVFGNLGRTVRTGEALYYPAETAEYMPPEVLMPGKQRSIAHPSMDVYALGVVLLDLVGNPAHRVPRCKMRAVVRSGLLYSDRFLGLVKACEPEYMALIKKCLHRDACERATVPDLLATVETHLSECRAWLSLQLITSALQDEGQHEYASSGEHPCHLRQAPQHWL